LSAAGNRAPARPVPDPRSPAVIHPPRQVVAYLVEQGLLDAQTVVAGDVVVEDASRRHPNFRIIHDSGPAYLVKQAGDAEQAAALAREAAIYEHLSAGDLPLRHYLPRLHRYDADEHVLVLELWTSARHLSAYHRRIGRCPPGVAAALARALATLHRYPLPAVGQIEAARTPACPPPLSLTFSRPTLALYRTLSLANHQLLRTIQQFPAFDLVLTSLRQTWQPRAWVHYDIKWENILMLPPLPKRRSQLKLVDWELAGLGDPCWDVGAVFGEYLSFWLLSMPISGSDPLDRFMEHARYPLAAIQPALRRFWQVYAQQMAFDEGTAYQWLERAVLYCAARLLQTAVEQSQVAAQPTASAFGLLQLSLNILQRPQEAVVHLLGIPWPVGGPP
jgi:thiamine kinase-like enzyme